MEPEKGKGRKILRNLLILVVIVVTSLALRSALHDMFPPGETFKAPPNKEESAYYIASAALGNKVDGKYELVDQDAKPFDISTWFDKPIVVSFIFTNCKMVCPMLTANLGDTIQKQKNRLGKDYRVLSIGFDHERDTPEAMREFGSEYVENFENWKFVTGPKKEVKALARKLGIVYEKMGVKGMWKHTVGITVVSPGGLVFAQIFGPSYSEKQLFDPIDRALGVKKE